MELWSVWLNGLIGLMTLLSNHIGISEAGAIIALTLLLRILCMPLSLKAAYQGYVTQQAMVALKPKLEALRLLHKDNRQVLATETMALYQQHGISFFGKWTMLNAILQSAVGIGIYQTVTSLSLTSRFMWIANLAKPDAWLTAADTLLMIGGMALMPGVTENSHSIWIMLIPVLLSLYFIATLPASVGLYWATSNIVTIVQSFGLRLIIRRQQAARSS
jgi:YidC/Oxa1 family membrane protein insertase